MITKRNFIDLLRNRLAGGTSPQDIDKLYPYGVVSKVLNFGIADVVRNNPSAGMDMAITYPFEYQTDSSGYYITLYPQPITGTPAIYIVSDDINTYNVQDKIMAESIRRIRGSNPDAAIYFGTKIRFNKKPTGTVRVTQVPNVYQMEDNDILIPSLGEDAGELDFFKMCFQILKTPEYQDNLNNNEIDAQQNA